MPTNHAKYATYIKKRASEGAISPKTAEMLLKQLEQIKKARPKALVENLDNNVVNQDSYYARNGQIAAAYNELMAFQINGSKGAQNTIYQARISGKKVTIFSYKT